MSDGWPVLCGEAETETRDVHTNEDTTRRIIGLLHRLQSHELPIGNFEIEMLKQLHHSWTILSPLLIQGIIEMKRPQSRIRNHEQPMIFIDIDRAIYRSILMNAFVFDDALALLLVLCHRSNFE